MRRQLAAALLGAALLTGGAQAVAEPTAARYVADEADVLSSETEQYIIDKNQELLHTLLTNYRIVANFSFIRKTKYMPAKW